MKRLERLLFDPSSRLSQPPLRRALPLLRFTYALLRDLHSGELSLRAMSLVYSSLIATVPLLAFSFSLLKGLGYHRQLEPLVHEFLRPVGDRADTLTARIMELIENVRGDVLGSIGLAFLIYTVISMIRKVELSFNFAWRVEASRDFGRRFSQYLSVMVMGPLLIVAAMGLLGALASHELVQTLSRLQPFGALIVTLGHLTPTMLVCMVFAFLYAYMPNARVSARAAIGGALLAGTAWVACGALFGSFVANSGRTAAIYAGFAIVIVALLWLYASWLILLTGARVAYYIQNPRALEPGGDEIELTPGLSERLALSVMYLVARGHRQTGRHWKTEELCTALQVPGLTLAPVISSLEKGGLLLVSDDNRLVPGRDSDCIGLADVADAVRHAASSEGSEEIVCVPAADAVARAMDKALRASAGGRTLAQLVADSGEESPAHLPGRVF